ncbi:MAG: glycosyltransferase family 1 protein [Leptolyngbya sp. SIOISBB]|nr:glycosyltransferase family 1 protein [Leptolyngbya sp. SIOISBB]
MMDLRTGTEYVVRNWVCASLRETYMDLMNTAQDADLIINGEGVLAARLVAEKLRIPWILTVLQPLAFLSAYDPSVLPALPAIFQLPGLNVIAQRGIRPLSKILSNAWAETVYQLRREIGLPPLEGNPLVDDKYSPGLVLAMFSPILAKPQPDWPINTILTGFTFYDGSEGGKQLPPDLEQFLNAGEPPIVFTLGSAAVVSPGNFYEESIKAVDSLGRRAVLLMGRNVPPANLPSSMIAVNYAPYSQLFSRACAIVHQGGIGTTAQALRAGRPTLVTPYSVDQPDNAARVERLGTSRTVARKRYTAKRVAKQLKKLLENPNYTARATEIGVTTRAEDGANIACDAIEKQLEAA